MAIIRKCSSCKEKAVIHRFYPAQLCKTCFERISARQSAWECQGRSRDERKFMDEHREEIFNQEVIAGDSPTLKIPASKKGIFKSNDRQFIIHHLSQQYGLRCWYCGLRFHNSYDSRIHIDHIVPKSKMGGDDWDNLAISCEFCNRAKLNHGLGEFLDWLEHINVCLWSPIKNKLREAQK